MLLMLAWAAGIIDAVSYLALDRVFTAMMTGNTVLLALAIGQGKAAAVLRSVLALVGFSAGAAMGALIVARGESRGKWPPAVTAALALEGVLLGGFTFVCAGSRGGRRSARAIIDAGDLVAAWLCRGGRGERVRPPPGQRVIFGGPVTTTE